MLPHFPLLKWKHLPQIYFSPCLFLCSGSQNIHPFLSVSLVCLLCFKWGQARILSSDHLHPRCSKLMFCVYPCWMFKVPLTLPCYPGALAYTCDLHIEGCSCLLVLYETMKPGVFMHMSVLATAASACVFTSYHTPLLFTPASLHCALIPPRLSGLPLFFFFFTHNAHSECILCYTACLYILHRTHNGQKAVSVLVLQGAGKDKEEPRSCLTGTKTSREKGKYGLLMAGVCVGSRYRNNTHKTRCGN